VRAVRVPGREGVRGQGKSVLATLGRKVASEIDAFAFGTFAAVDAVMPSATHEGLNQTHLENRRFRAADLTPPAPLSLDIFLAHAGK
jgi:hypothetical protein